MKLFPVGAAVDPWKVVSQQRSGNDVLVVVVYRSWWRCWHHLEFFFLSVSIHRPSLACLLAYASDRPRFSAKTLVP